MNMAQLSVRQAAERLGVSDGRVRQRIEAGEIRAEKIGGRWLVDLPAGECRRPSRGRPVDPRSVLASLIELDVDPIVDDLSSRNAEPMLEQVGKVSAASRWRAQARLRSALLGDDFNELIAWLRWRGERREYVAAAADFDALRGDPLIVLSGLSVAESGMRDVALVEGYVAGQDVEPLAARHWLEEPRPGERANVIIHAVPERPLRLSRLLLAADLAEHGGPRELQRAHELIDEVAALLRGATPEHGLDHQRHTRRL
jgi:excisionase family DNA binding protein